MHPTINHITFDAVGDPYHLARFWSELLGRPMSVEDQPGDPEAVVLAANGAPTLLFVRVPEGKSVKNRVHLDITPSGERTRDMEVDRAIKLGATLFADHRREDGSGFVTLADPEGNEFCVERSVAERG
ncbi:MAG TPA: VOC family protein [Actinocatenispora sp.]